MNKSITCNYIFTMVGDCFGDGGGISKFKAATNVCLIATESTSTLARETAN